MIVKIICAVVLLAGMSFFVLGVQDLFALRRSGELVPAILWAKLGGVTALNSICGWLLIRRPDVNAKKRAENAKRRAAEAKAHRIAAAANNLSQLQE